MGYSTYVENIQNYFRNVTHNSVGVEREFLECIATGEVGRAIGLMDGNDTDVENALTEYYPQKHKVMSRRDKHPKGKDVYYVCKLPRARQRYINEIELFFLLGNPIKWSKIDGSDAAFNLFKDFLRETRFDSTMRSVKRIAGSETEAAKLYHLYRDENNNAQISVVTLARSKGYRLRTMFDQYGNLVAFAYGYVLREKGKGVMHWDIQTAQNLIYCSKGATAWDVEILPNPTGKINILYYRQPKAWDGVEPRLEREEMLDSKIGDANNYFADPTLVATADAISSIADTNTTGKLIQITGTNSDVRYLNPPQSSELRTQEKQDLRDSILFDTFTPDFSFEALKGLGTLSGKAIKNAMSLAYIKRANRIEMYGEVVDREKNVIIACLKFLHPEMTAEFDKLKVSFEFSEPFDEDIQSGWSAISQLYSSGLISLETAISELGVTDAPKQELKRIQSEKGAQAKSEEEKPQEIDKNETKTNE